jgi:hypothetical protein
MSSADIFAFSMIAGMTGASIFNGVMAGTIEYTQKCEHVKDLHNRAANIDEWCNKIDTKFLDLDHRIDDEIDMLQVHIRNIKISIKENNQKYEKLLKREQIFGAIFSSLVSLLLTLKYMLRNF